MPDEWKYINLPTDLTVIGVGGCGKRLVNKIFEHDWFLKHYLYQDIAHGSLRFYTIDTATNEVQDDNTKVDAFRDKIENLIASDRDHFRNPIEYTHYCLPDMIAVYSIHNLATNQICNDVKEISDLSMRAKTWWINDPANEIYLDDLKRVGSGYQDNISAGVLRRRALSKAFFYKTLTSANAGQFPAFNIGNSYAIIVGLGGGTGSGIFLDLARYISRINQNVDITLFAILPSSNEGEMEMLNASVALSELEYLQIHSKGTIKRVIVSTLEPTRYNGSIVNKEFEDFDNAFAYTFLNYMKLSQNAAIQLGDARSEYAGLMFAASHVIEYPVIRLNDLNDKLSQLIEKFGSISDTHKVIVDNTDAFITDIKSNPDFNEEFDMGVRQENVNYNDYAVYKDEVERVIHLWENPVLTKLDFKTPEIIKNCIEQQLQNKQPDDYGRSIDGLITYVESLYNVLRAFGDGQTENANMEDTKLYAFILKYLEIILSSMRTHQSALKIIETDASYALREVIKGNSRNGEYGVRLENRERELRDESGRKQTIVEQKSQNINENNQQKITECERIKKEAQDIIDRTEESERTVQQNVDTAHKSIDSIYERLDRNGVINNFLNLKSTIDECISAQTDYIQQLEEYIRQLNNFNMNEPIQYQPFSNSIANREGLINAENAILSLIGPNLRLGNLRELITKYYWNKHIYRLSRLTTKILNKPKYPQLQGPNYPNKIAEIAADIRKLYCGENGIIQQIQEDGTFNIMLNQSFLKDIYDEKINQCIRQDILSEFTGTPVCLNPTTDFTDIIWSIDSHISDLNGGIQNNIAHVKQDIKDCIYEAVDRREGYSEKLTAYAEEIRVTNENRDKTIAVVETNAAENIHRCNADINDAQSAIEKNTKKINFFGRINEFILSNLQTLQKYVDKTKEYDDMIKELGDTLNNINAVNNDSAHYRTVFNQLDQGVLPLIRNQPHPSLANFDAGGDRGRKELEQLKHSLEQKYPRIMDTTILGIDAFHIPFENGNEYGTWSFDKSLLIFSSMSHGITQSIQENPNRYVSAINNIVQPTDRNNVSVDISECAKPWEIATTFIVSAGPLDLLSVISSQHSYWDVYRRNKNNYLHHVLYMDKGIYLTRNEKLSNQDAAILAHTFKNGSDEKIDEARRKLDKLYTIKSFARTDDKKNELIASFNEYISH